MSRGGLAFQVGFKAPSNFAQEPERVNELILEGDGGDALSLRRHYLTRYVESGRGGL